MAQASVTVCAAADLTPWPPAALDRHGYAGWLVAESELGEGWRGLETPGDTARAQWAGLRAIGEQ